MDFTRQRNDDLMCAYREQLIAQAVKMLVTSALNFVIISHYFENLMVVSISCAKVRLYIRARLLSFVT